MIARTALALLLAATAAAQAAPTLDAAVLAELSRCDQRFFGTLQGQAAALAGVASYRSHGALAWFRVDDRRHPVRSSVRFETPLQAAGLTLVGYFDEVLDVGERESAVSWGFLVRAPLAEVVGRTRPLVWEAERLRADGGLFVRSELWWLNSPELGWRREDTPGGQPARPGSVERVLLIEPASEDGTLTRFGCSLQGSVHADMLQRLRPDLGL